MFLTNLFYTLSCFAFCIRNCLLLLLSGSVLLATPFAHAEAQFLQHRAYDPFTALFGLPAPAAKFGKQAELQVAFVHNNVFMGGTSNGSGSAERLLLDGETSQLALRYTRRIGSCLATTVAGGWASHSSGWFDRAIDDWHQFFGLPDAGRDEAAFHELNYSWQSDVNEAPTFALDTAKHGPTDLFVSVQRDIGCAGGGAVARLGVKLPLGKLKHWTGSGATDVFFDVQSRWWQPNPSHRLGASLGVLLPGSVKEVQELRDWVGYGSVAWQWQLPHSLNVGLQLDWHSALLNSDLLEVGSTAGMIAMNVRFAPRNKVHWEFSVFEDIIPDTAPDIAIRLALTTPID